MDVMKKYSRFSNVKSRNMTKDSLDMIIELRPSSENDLLKEILGIEGVQSASLLSHDGEVTF